jgi:membrane-associated phospholipid phosphatase
VLGILGALAFVVNRAGAMVPVDQVVQSFIRSIRDPAWDGLVTFATRVGHVGPTFAIALLLSVIGFRTGPRWAWIAPLFIVLTVGVEFWVKHSLTRPVHLGEILSLLGSVLGNPLHLPGTFPSGHVARLSFLASIGSQLMPRIATLVLMLLVAASFVARMYVGSHRFSEVLGGLALGLAVGGAAAAWLRWRAWASRAAS